MTHVHASTRRSEQGFTLVELAIVMVIIGLLIGGILKGQELIANAKISGTVGQLKGLDAAMNTFDDKYNAKPGLMTDATDRLPGCVAPCVDATGGATYGTNLTTQPGALNDPKALVFLHLSAADLISGIDPSGGTPLTFGKALPTVKAGGGMWIGTAGAATEIGNTLSVGRPYAVLNGDVVAVSATSGALSPTTVAQIDRKLDDGQPEAGAFQAEGTNCTTGAAPVIYDEANTAAVCAAASRVLN